MSPVETTESPHRWVSCGQENDKGRRQVDVLVSQGDEDTSTRPADLSVQHRVQDGVVTLNVLKVGKKKRKKKKKYNHTNQS